MAHVELVGHAHAAVQLHGLLADEARCLADQHLGPGHGVAACGRVGVAAVRGGQVDHRACLFELDQHVGHAVLQGLEAADRHAELLARAAVFDGRLEDALERAEGVGAERGDAVVDDFGEGRGDIGAESRIGVDLDVVEFEVGGALTVDRVQRVAGQARGVARHGEQPDALVIARRDQHEVGHRRVIDHAFRPVQGPARSAARRARGDPVDADARLRFLVGEHGDALAAGQRRQPACALRVGAAAHDRIGGDDRAGQERFEEQAVTGRLGDEHDPDRAGADAAVGLRNVDREQAELGQLRPDLARPSGLRFEQPVALLEAVGAGQEALRRVEQHLLFVVE